jgi:large subunit ribosomal protein L13
MPRLFVHSEIPFEPEKTPRITEMATFVPSAKDIKRDWFLMDAENVVIGRLASEAARLLIGKHKPSYTTFLDTGDHVIIVNAAKVAFTGRKLEG